MTPDNPNQNTAAYVTMAIFAWNEEHAIKSTLHSLLEQSIFERLRLRKLRCEVICVANGCTDRTPEVAAEVLREVMLQHPDRSALSCRITNLQARGKVNAWNEFVHNLSAREARFLFLMDADILIHREETMGDMLRTREQDTEAVVAVDVPHKDIAFKKNRSIGTRLSLGASRMTLAAEGQLCGQLYCIRAEVARKVYLPKDLAACEDGFIKALASTDFLSHEPWVKRIRVAREAEHTFEAYTSPIAILRNQKRQIMGQTIVHVLVDQYLKGLPPAQRDACGSLLKANDADDPFWLKRLIHDHLQTTRFFWRLYPGLFANRFRHLRKLDPIHWVVCFPAAVAGSCMAFAASFMAHRSLKNGCTDYWPKAKRMGFEQSSETDRRSAALTRAVSQPQIKGLTS